MGRVFGFSVVKMPEFKSTTLNIYEYNNRRLALAVSRGYERSMSALTDKALEEYFRAHWPDIIKDIPSESVDDGQQKS